MADPEERAYLQHQQWAAKITIAEEARTLVEGGKCVAAIALAARRAALTAGSRAEQRAPL